MGEPLPQSQVHIFAILEGPGGSIRGTVSLLADRGLEARCCQTLYQALGELIELDGPAPAVLFGHVQTLARHQRLFLREIRSKQTVVCCCLVPDKLDETLLAELVEAVREEVPLAASARQLADCVVRTAEELHHRVATPSPRPGPRGNGPVRPGELLTNEEANALIGGIKP